YTFYISFFLFHTTASTEIYTLSLHDALPICGQAYSQTVFFEDERAFKDFTSGHFEFGADASAVAITAAAEASAGTAGASAGASGGKKDAVTAGSYHNGLAVFTIVKGGAMYQATVAGQKFKFTPQSQ